MMTRQFIGRTVSMMIEADLTKFAICEKYAEVGDGMQSGIIQVHALGLWHKDGAAET